jgi:sugar phosphate isomerase/epimerase
MRVGIFAKTFNRSSLPGILDAVKESGFSSIQFNMACAGLPSMPEFIPEDLPLQIAAAVSERGLTMAALSGTFNMIHPDESIRQQGLQSLQQLIRYAGEMNTSVITLCTGSYNTKDMWCFHPDNNSREAWSALCQTMEKALEMAETSNVVLAIEPERANVVNTTKEAKQLISEMGSKHLKVVFDPANLFEVAEQKEIEKLISEGLRLLSEHIVIAHAKDRRPDGSFTTAGLGVLPYAFFLKSLKETGFDGDIITHGLSETEVLPCSIFLLKQLSSLT